MTDRDLLEVLLKKVTGMEEKIEGMGNRLDNIENNMVTKREFETIESKIDGITKQVANNSEQLSELSNKEDLEYYDKKISQLDREIFKIKQRA